MISLGVVVVAVGIWLITRVDAVNNACSVNASPSTGAGVSPNCMNMVSMYFLGFALIIGGLVFLLLALLAMAKRVRDVDHPVAPTSVTPRSRATDTKLHNAA